MLKCSYRSAYNVVEPRTQYQAFRTLITHLPLAVAMSSGRTYFAYPSYAAATTMIGFVLLLTLPPIALILIILPHSCIWLFVRMPCSRTIFCNHQVTMVKLWRIGLLPNEISTSILTSPQVHVTAVSSLYPILSRSWYLWLSFFVLYTPSSPHHAFLSLRSEFGSCMCCVLLTLLWWSVGCSYGSSVLCATYRGVWTTFVVCYHVSIDVCSSYTHYMLILR